VDESHSATLVNVPVSVREPEFELAQTEVLPETVPEDAASTVITAGVENAETFGGEGASKTSARYQVVVFRLAYTRLTVVFEIFVQDAPLVVEDCHRTTFPVCPLKVTRPLLVPEQTLVLPLTEPPTDCAKEKFITKKRVKKENAFLINKMF
jgi:hypothetical protein